MQKKMMIASLVACCLPLTAFAYDDFKGIGRDATPNEVKAWNIDVRPDFQGLPPGQGSVSDGEDLWEEKCASCHGDFGDSNSVFFPLIGNTTADDIKTGHAAALKDHGKVRTTMMKVPTISTLWDFIDRAMPWNAPKTLTPDEVYSLVAYMVYLADMVPDDFVLSDKNIADVQKLMPNRNGITTDHGMWSVKGKPDTHNTECMKKCEKEVTITSTLPEYAYDAHGDLSVQTRDFGPVRGWPVGGDEEKKADAAVDAKPAAPTKVMTANGCLSCHALDHAVVGPALEEVAKKYADRADAADYLVKKIREGGSGVWGQVPMPPQPNISDDDVKTIADWLAAGGK